MKVSQQQWEQASQVLALTQSKGWEVIQNFLYNLPKYPNPKDFTNMESVMIPYIQAYGTTEAVRQIFSFIDEQKLIVEKYERPEDGEEDRGNSVY